MSDLTRAQAKMLRAFAECQHADASGCLDKLGNIVVAGERVGDASVALRLVTLSLLAPAGPHRLTMTDEGRLAAENMKGAR